MMGREKTSGSAESTQFAGLRLGLSFSEPEDIAERELSSADLNRFATRLTRIVLDRRGGVVSGHDWRPRGIMRALAHFARRSSSELEDRTRGEPPLRNFIPWPDRPALTAPELAGLSHVLRVEALPLPPWCKTVLDHLGEPEHPHGKLARHFAVSELRYRLTEASDARVCFGGKHSSFTGRYPGILEELVLALAKRQPVYLLGWAGGITADAIQLLSGKAPKNAERAANANPKLADAFNEIRARIKTAAQSTTPPWVPEVSSPWKWSPADLRSYLQKQKGAFSREVNGLSLAENQQLWRTSSIDESIDLVLLGLSRLRQKKPPVRTRTTKKTPAASRTRRR